MKLLLGKIRSYRKGLFNALAAILLIVLLLQEVPLQATHIVGGEIYYECLGNNQYRVTLKVYRDCFFGQAPFDSPAIIGVFDGNGNFLRTEYFTVPQIANIPIVLNNPCLVAPPNVCVEEGVYQQTVTLPPNGSGYYLAYQRCCRNRSIQNLVVPGGQGATYTAFIPDSAQVQCNSSPRFSHFPPVAICANEPLNFDHSASDPDGDSLVYKLCAPFHGGSTIDPAPNPPSGPPYTFVNYASGYSPANPMAASPAISINPSSGLLTGTPTIIGQYVVGVCVEEYHNGVLIATHKRDFQFNVANCNKTTVAAIPIPTVGDTSINECSGFTINFGNNSIGATTYFWDFGVDHLTNDTSDQQYPTYVYPDTGTYRAMLIANPRSACSDTDMVTVKVYPLMVANFGAMDACPKTALPFSDSSSTTMGVLTSWSWNFGDGNNSSAPNPSHSYAQGGVYTVTLTVKNSIGCRATANRNVTVHPGPKADFTIDGFCIFQEVRLRDTSTVTNDQVVRWEWLLEGGGLLDSVPNTTHVFTDDGYHDVTLIVTTTNGCTDTITKPVEIEEKPEAHAWSDTTVCAGEQVQLFGSGGKTYSWGASNGTLNTTQQNPIVHPVETTTYIYTAANDCYFDTAQVRVKVFPPPAMDVRPDTSIFVGQWVDVYAQGPASLKYSWQPGNGTFDTTAPYFEIAPSRTITYTVTATDANGCKTVDEVTIVVRPICEDLFVPSAFSPNGDGLNDRFAPKDYGQNALEELRIYNRWGDLLFRTRNFEQGWDGTYNGINQETGTYVYIIEGTCERTPMRYKGNVTLLR